MFIARPTGVSAVSPSGVLCVYYNYAYIACVPVESRSVTQYLHKRIISDTESNTTKLLVANL